MNSKNTELGVGAANVAAVKECSRRRTTTHRSTASLMRRLRWISSTAMMMVVLALAIIMPPQQQQQQQSQTSDVFFFVEGQQAAGRVMTGLGSKLQDQQHQKTKSSGGGGGGSSGRRPKLNHVKQAEIVVEGDHVVAMSGLESVDLGFSDLYLEMKQKKKKKKRKTKNGDEESNGETRLLLDGSIRGRARPGRMLAIMGPSGAGKSTVLHALAGKIKESSKLRLEGNRYVNGQPITGDSQVPAAFVEQEVTFFPHMTVRETLAFRVELKLGSLISKHAQAERVDELIEELNLSKAADTIVGDAKVRGISGGERRRLAIACELIASPSLIFLDEPTSGLDSTAATSIVESMRKLADSGKTIIAVIHQPSQHVFDAFDDLLLLSEGKQMYFGSVDGVRDYMNSHVAKAPQGMGTAEHVLDCISKLKMPGETDEDMMKRIDRVTDLAKKEKIAVGAPTSSNTMERYTGDTHTRRANIFVQFKLLLRRALRENLRGKAALIIKLVQQVSLGLIYGTIYSIDLSQASIQNRFGLLSLIAIGAANMALASTVRSFPREKAIVSSELAGNLYATLPYFVGKAISEIPLTVFLNSVFGFIVSALTGINGTWEKLRRFLGITSMNTLSGQAAGLMLGSVAPSQDAALAMFPAVMVLNIIFDGKNISQESTPWFLRWLPKVGLIRWGFEGLCLNEFEGLEFETKGPRRGPVARNGVEALSRFGLGDNTVADVLKTQLMLISGSWFLSYLGLTLSRQKFQCMEEPKKTKEDSGDNDDDSSRRKNGSTTS
eukprot:CAMPEP_0113481860 /NCGR_PEP_ID=MMETSP0014_2-20120614/22624_1 /TAXON_ID=2857 /ORGANISM="Nitzschia sp." /LENGTH=777 /DNA_ID=CAMNT_0000375365 /DNA_START=288 /DNA_END=2621 /DNA_ORIENTATION=- /assembly_acc=CAM_ASM_000159